MKSYWGIVPDKVVQYNSRNKYSGKMNQPDMRLLTDTNTGSKYSVPEDDYQQFKTKHTDQSIEQYVSEAFDFKKNHFDIQRVNGGHIEMLEYSDLYKVLRVTYAKASSGGRTVAYMNVPHAIAGELLYHAKTGATGASPVNGRERHLVGIRFWDLIRVRGDIHGTRYPFQYVADAEASEGSDTYRRGTATPDWGKAKFAFVRDPMGRLKAKPVTALTEDERKEMEDRVNSLKYENANTEGYTISSMYKRINNANIESSAKQYLIREMDAINKGKGSEAERCNTMYSYLRTYGLL